MKKNTTFRFTEAQQLKMKLLAEKKGLSLQHFIDTLLNLAASDDARDCFPVIEDVLNTISKAEQIIQAMYEPFGADEIEEPVSVEDLRERLDLCSQILSKSELIQKDDRAFALDLEDKTKQVFRFAKWGLTPIQKNILNRLDDE